MTNLLRTALSATSCDLWEIDYLQTATHADLNPIGDERPYVFAQIAGSSHHSCLYDTGAMVCVMSTDTFNKTININGDVQLTKAATLTVAKKTGKKDPVKMRAQTCMVSFSVLGQYVESFPLRISPDLSSQTGCIIGADLIHQLKLSYNAETKKVVAPGHKALKPINAITIAPNSTEIVDFEIKTLCSDISSRRSKVNVFDSGPEEELIISPMICAIDKTTTKAIVTNPTAEPKTLRSDEVYGRGRTEEEAKLIPLNKLKATSSELCDYDNQDVYQRRPLTAEKKKYLLEHLKVGPQLTPEQQNTLIQLVIDHHEAFGGHEYDIGVTNTYTLDIRMKTEEPIYVKQFRIPDTHRDWLIEHVKKLLAIGVIERSTSRWNSPVFAVTKPSGGLRMIIDLRKINSAMVPHYYVGEPLESILDRIGKMGAQYFSVTDTLKGFFGLRLSPESRKFTGFSIHGFGKFQYTTAPQGLLSSPASYNILMTQVLVNLEYSMSYVDDVITASKSFSDHVLHLGAFLKRMAAHDLRLNIEKCQLGFNKVAYLGFELTPEGTRPGIPKTECIDKFKPPTTKKQIQSFCGLINYFRRYLHNFQQYSSKLTSLTKKTSTWKGGELPPEAMEAFNILKKKLVTRPILRFPDYTREFHVSCDGCTGKMDDSVGKNTGGGIGAALTQVDDKGDEYVIGYASRALRDHENNYPALLVETAAVCFALEQFEVYLRGRKFRLWTDHKPLLSTQLKPIHRKTLNRLEELIFDNGYDFVIEHKAGVDNTVADWCSRVHNEIAALVEGPVINAVGHDTYHDLYQYNMEDLKTMQDNDDWCAAVKEVLLGARKKDLKDPLFQKQVTALSRQCFLSADKIVFYRPINKKGSRAAALLLTPKAMQHDIIKMAHNTISMGGHSGILDTQNRVLDIYFWNSVLQDCSDFVSSCLICQEMNKTPGPRAKDKGPYPMQTYPEAEGPNQRCHIDIAGPFVKSQEGFRYCLTMVDSSTRYVKLAALKTKEAKEAGIAFVHTWCLSFGVPTHLIHDQGGEWLNDFTQQVLLSLGISNGCTLPYRPQANSSAEVFHKSLSRFFRAFLEEKREDFVHYLRLAEFSYNTSRSVATGVSPASLMLTFPIRLPFFDQEGVKNLFGSYHEAGQVRREIEQAMQYAKENGRTFKDTYVTQYNKDKTPPNFKEGDLVMVYSPLQALRRSRQERAHDLRLKLSRPWCGPARVIRVKAKTYGPDGQEKEGPGVTIEFSRSSGIRTRGAQPEVHPERLKIYKLAEGEPHPFKKPLLHKRWKAIQLGHATPEGEGQEPERDDDQPRRRRRRRAAASPSHPMRLRRRPGELPVPEDGEEIDQLLYPNTSEDSDEDIDHETDHKDGGVDWDDVSFEPDEADDDQDSRVHPVHHSGQLRPPLDLGEEKQKIPSVHKDQKPEGENEEFNQLTCNKPVGEKGSGKNGANNPEKQENRSYLSTEGICPSSSTEDSQLNQGRATNAATTTIGPPEAAVGRWEKLKQRLLPAKLRRQLQ